MGDGWAISSINGTEILEMPFVKEIFGANSSQNLGVVRMVWRAGLLGHVL